MTTATAPYRSTKSVPDRVDRAWGQGYTTGVEDGRREWRRIALVSIALAAFTLWRRQAVKGHAHLLPWALIASLFATAMVLAVAPFVLAAIVLRAGMRRYRALPSSGPDTPARRVIDPGDADQGWETF
jgi:hypothetical protein